MTYRDALRCELARRDFWEYCKLLAPDFYKEDRKFLKDKCREYQDFYESPDEYLIDNEPPRHGKSRTATLFVQWVIGKCVRKIKSLLAHTTKRYPPSFQRALETRYRKHLLMVVSFTMTFFLMSR